jgi:hypothetical protein
MKSIADYQNTFDLGNDYYMANLDDGTIQFTAGEETTIYQDEQEACEAWERLIEERNIEPRSFDYTWGMFYDDFDDWKN